MTISDLSAGMKCTLLIKIGKTELTHDTVIMAIYEKKQLVMVKPIEKDGKYISLKGAVTHLLFEIENTKPEVFKVVFPVLFYDKRLKEQVYAIPLKQVSVSYNRRGSYRCYVGDRVNVQIGNNRKTVECVLKDVSATGFALVFEKSKLSPDYDTWSDFHAVYNLSNEDVGGLRFGAIDLRGEVVRIVDVGEDKVLFGCRHLDKVYVLEGYIRDRERCTIKKNNQRPGGSRGMMMTVKGGA